MRLSKRGEYGLRAMITLAEASQTGISPVMLQIKEISQREQISPKFLEQILLELKVNGLVISRRGRSGGYTLLPPPEAITVSQVLRIVDGPIAPLGCISRTAYASCPDCPSEADCAIRRMFADTYAATLEMMEGTTLASALGDFELSDHPPVATVPSDFVGTPEPA